MIVVEDGDTIFIYKGSERITVRLAGIDAPEIAHARTKEHPLVYGQQGSGGSIAYLTSVINNYRSNLELWVVPGAKTHGRLVGVLIVGNLNVNLALVRRGLATSFAPEGASESQPGIKMGYFRAAEKRAFSAGQGLFELAQYRAQYALNKAHGDVANVQIASPDRQANSWTARVRARAIEGLRSADHSANVPHAIQGMNPGRGDFGGGRTPGNPTSMGLVDESMIQGALGSDYGAWREAIQYLQGLSKTTGGFQFADIETTGLRATDMITEAAYSRITGMSAKHYNWAVTPQLPSTADPADLMVGLSTAYESALNEGVRKRLMYPGSFVMGAIPSQEVAGFIPGGTAGAPLTFDNVRQMLQTSSFRSAPRQLQQIEGLIASGRTADMSDIISMMFGDKAPGRQFMFIQNPRFEASKMAPHISDEGFHSMLASGQLAAGSPTYKSIYQNFDLELSKHADAAFRLERQGKSGASHRADWYKRLRHLIGAGGGKGTAVIDIQDITRSVFGMAGMLDEKVATAMPGLLSQDVLGRVLGLQSEAHIALSDKLQSQVVVAKMFQMGDAFTQALATGNPTGVAHYLDNIKRAAHMQKTLGMFGVFKDLGQRVQHMSNLGVPEDRMVATWKGQDLTELKRQGDFYFIGGEKIPVADAPKVFYAGGGVQELPLAEYGKRRLQATLPGITEEQAGRISREMVGLAIQSPDTVGRYTSGDIYSLIERGMMDTKQAIGGEPLQRLGGRLAEFEGSDPREMPIERHFDYLSRQLRQQIPKEVKAAVPESGKSTKELLGVLTKSFEDVPGQAVKWWNALPQGTRRGLGYAGAGVAVLGSLGIIRGMFEDEEQAVPESVDFEGYLAAQQTVDALAYLNESVDMEKMLAAAHYNSNNLVTSRKDPGRYYGNKV